MVRIAAYFQTVENSIVAVVGLHTSPLKDLSESPKPQAGDQERSDGIAPLYSFSFSQQLFYGRFLHLDADEYRGIIDKMCPNGIPKVSRPVPHEPEYQTEEEREWSG